MSVSKNGKTLANQKEKNEVILKKFSEPKFNQALAANAVTTTVAANIVASSIATYIKAKTTVGAVALTCLGQAMSQNITNTLVTQVKNLEGRCGVAIRTSV